MHTKLLYNPLYSILILMWFILGINFRVSAEEIKSDINLQNVEIAQKNKDEDKEKEEKPELQGIPGNIKKIAEKITVRIDSPNGNGSGVIFAKDGDEYYIVTAKHVVDKKQIYQIITEDNEVYAVEPKNIEKFENTDLAILTFVSDQGYQVAEFSNYNIGLNAEFWVFAYGWAKSELEAETIFTVGKVVGRETGIFLVKDDLSLTQTNGYELIYTNLSEEGMSGGPILDTNGKVIGIHTSAEGERYHLTNNLQLGFSLGIPIGTFLESQKLKSLVASRYLELHTIKERADVVPFFRPNLSVIELNYVTSNLLKSPGNNADEVELVNYGNQLWRSFRYSEALDAFDKAIAKNTSFHQAYYGQGLALYDQGKYDEANKAFQQAIKLDSSFYPAWYRQSLSLLKLKQYSQALEVINQSIALKPENTALYALQGQALQHLSRYDEAINSYNKVIETDNNPLILTRRGSIYRVLKGASQFLAKRAKISQNKRRPMYLQG